MIHDCCFIEFQVYNDLDIIFCMDQSRQFGSATQQTYDLDKVKDSALLALLDFLPEEANRDRLSPGALSEAYLHKMVKIDGSRTGSTSFDRWSLISLSNIVGRSVEIKFVVSMRRQYEFSIDSFQVIACIVCGHFLWNEMCNFFCYSEIAVCRSYRKMITVGEHMVWSWSSLTWSDFNFANRVCYCCVIMWYV